MRAILAVVMSCLLASTALGQSCNSAPKPLDGIKNFEANTLVLNGRSSFYELDSCFILSRRQFGSTLRLGFVNNFDKDSVSKIGMVFVRSLKTFVGAAPPDFLKLSRGAGWQLQVPPAKAIAELDPSYDRPFKGTIDQWNQIYADNKGPDDLVTSSGFTEPWHAYADALKNLSSTEQGWFWKLDSQSLPSQFTITHYLIRFTPDKTYSLIPFTILLQSDVAEVKITISSNIDALVQDYRIIVR